MKNHIHKHKLIFITALVILSFVSVFSFTYNNISTTNINVASTLPTPAADKAAEYEASSEEKEAPRFNIFNILNKFIPN